MQKVARFMCACVALFLLAAYGGGGSATDLPYDDDFESPPPVSGGCPCSDGIDNDGDGDIDFPADRGCTSATDDSETVAPVAGGSLVAFADPLLDGGWVAGADWMQEFGRFFVVAPDDEPMAVEEFSLFVPPGVMFLDLEIWVDGDLIANNWAYSGSSETGWNITVWLSPDFLVNAGDGVAFSVMLLGVIPENVPQLLDPAVYLSNVLVTGVISGDEYFTGAVKGQSGLLYVPSDEKG